MICPVHHGNFSEIFPTTVCRGLSYDICWCCPLFRFPPFALLHPLLRLQESREVPVTLRKACCLCVRLKRACDGKSPCHLCIRR